MPQIVLRSPGHLPESEDVYKRQDLFGALLFLLPVCLLIAVDSWNFFLIAYQTREASPNPGGLAWWPLKFAIPTAFILLSLQGVSEMIKNIAALTGDRPLPDFKGGH